MTKLRSGYFFSVLVLCAALSACQLTGSDRAPIINAGTSVGNVPEGGGTTTRPVGGAQGETMYYTVQAGDSLYKIASQYGQRWQEIAAWNNITEPYTLKVGQQLLVSRAGGTQVAANGNDNARGTSPGGSTSVIQPAGGDNGLTVDRMQWTWPAKGTVITNFNSTTKGIDIGGKAGDPVYAAADGRVAYVGNGLRGYGNLVIVKHNDIFVTAYAHNQKILVEENQVVHKGEQIAEMGDTDASRVMLHFEVRQQTQEGGNPVDPMKYLPTR